MCCLASFVPAFFYRKTRRKYYGPKYQLVEVFVHRLRGEDGGGGPDKGKQLSQPYNCLLNKTPFDLMKMFLKFFCFPLKLPGILWTEFYIS